MFRTAFCYGFLLTLLEVHAIPTVPPSAAPGTYVTDIAQCPQITPRTATSIHDLRPDDFSVTMAVGDSISAGAFAKGIQSNALLNFAEWRGVSYAGGGDPGAITVPNLMKHYRNNLQGASKGYNGLPEICFGPLCPLGPFGWHQDVDQLNSAQSGALASNLLHEVRDYLVPQVQARGIPASAFKYLNLQIGSNDLCQLCLAASTRFGPGSADDFEARMRETLEYIRLHIPNTLVNLVGVFQVSEIYTLTIDQPYCQQLIPFLPHANLECSCALFGGALGQATRAQMDMLQTQYNERLLKIVKDYQMARYPKFAVTWQPANLPLNTYPVQSLSNIDCFHPSEAAHKRIAAGIWNRLTGDAATRALPFNWENTISFRCLEDGDRIPTDGAL